MVEQAMIGNFACIIVGDSAEWSSLYLDQCAQENTLVLLVPKNASPANQRSVFGWQKV
jgi:hypothetical protein